VRNIAQKPEISMIYRFDGESVLMLLKADQSVAQAQLTIG
jgi:hypothetical protein